MALIPIADVDTAVEKLLAAVRTGASNFSRKNGQNVRLGAATLSMEVVFDGAEVVESRQTGTQDAGTTRTTQTEQPYSQYTETVKSGSVKVTHGQQLQTQTEEPYSQYTETVKSGSYTQAGSNNSSQGGGSTEETEYTYDEAS